MNSQRTNGAVMGKTLNNRRKDDISLKDIPGILVRASMYGVILLVILDFFDLMGL